MEKLPKYSFAADEIRIANEYNAVYIERLGTNLGIFSAQLATRRIVLQNIVNSPENVQTSGGAFRDAVTAIDNGVPLQVAIMYEDAYTDNAIFDDGKE